MRASLAAALLALGCSSSHAPPSSPPNIVGTETPPATTPPPAPSRYPAAPRGTVVDTIHGKSVADPYRWLEAMDSPETRAWIAAENKLADDVLGKLPGRDKLQTRLAELFRYDRYYAPSKRGKRVFWVHNTGGAGQSLIESSTQIDGEAKVVLDGSELSKDGSTALASFVASSSNLFAYGTAKGGGDWQTWRVRDAETGKDLPDELPNIKYYNPVFAPDGKGMYYSRFPAPAAGTELTAVDKDCKVYFHAFGTTADKDVVIYERPDQPAAQFDLELTRDSKYLVISIGEGQVGDTGKYQIAYLDLAKRGAKPVVIVDAYEAEYVFAGSDGPLLYFMTNLEAPTKRVIAIDVRTPARAKWKTIVPAGKDTIDKVAVGAKRLFVTTLSDAHAAVTAYDLQGKNPRPVALPGLGNVYGFGGNATDKELFYMFSDFTTPTTVMRYDVATGKSTPWKQPKVAFTPADFETKQVFFPAKDGTKVPMFVTGKKGFALDGARPTIMTAYGFGGVSMLPYFTPDSIAWLERGGLTVLVNIRGGGEYGDAWAEASSKAKRQVGVDDFIAAGEYLIANKYTSRAHLGVTGGSGGGLLVGTATVQRPDLYGASIPLTGVHDLLRFQLFGQGAGWQAAMGSIDKADEFAALLATSPLHNVKPNTKYPPMLIVTADNDVRVAPLHSYKLAAALQHAQAGDAPIVLRVETHSGHGGGSTGAQKVAQRTDILAFFAAHLGLKLD